MLESVFAEYDIVPDVVTKAPQDIISVSILEIGNIKNNFEKH